MDVPWNDVSLFLNVAETGSFSGAARAVRLGQATVSRRFAMLEEALGATLFRRGVEGAVLTEAGERLLPAALRMAESAADFVQQVALDESKPEGLVRGENLAVGFASVASVAFLTSIVNPKYAAVQYALLASLIMLIGSLGRRLSTACRRDRSSRRLSPTSVRSLVRTAI